MSAHDDKENDEPADSASPDAGLPGSLPDALPDPVPIPIPELSVVHRAGVAVITPRDTSLLDDRFVSRLSQFISQLGDDAVKVVLDMSHVNVAASIFFGHLIGLRKQLLSRGGEVALAAMRDAVAKAYEVAALHKLIPSYDQTDIAVSDLSA